jgi:cell division septation protein DedD
MGQPLADIVWHCLDPECGRRWTVEQVKARLNGPAIEPVPSTGADDARSSGRGVPKWIYAGLATLILAVVLAAVVRNKDSAPVATSVAAATPAMETPATDRPAIPAELPASPAVTAPRAEAPPAASRLDARKASGWSVIVGAYGSREPAEKWMRAMKKKWPSFEISLLETQAEKTRYLVVLGQNLSEDRAEALRQRAVEAGLPRSTYIKRVM